VGALRWSVGLVVAAVVVLGAAGCTGSDGVATPTTDAGSDASSTHDVAEAAPPAPPELRPCPVGWREVAGDPPTCDPWPAAGRSACAEHESHFPGEPGCASIGRACPVGDFGDPPTDRAVLYVRPGPGPGDGTASSPFATIAQALAAASPGTVVLLARGRYDEHLALPAGVSVWGACAEGTVLTMSSPSATAISTLVEATGASTELRDVRIDSPAGAGVVVRGASAALEIDGLLIAGARGTGVLASDGAHVVASTVVVRDTRASPSGLFGRAFDCETGAVLTARRIVAERNREFGIYVGPADTRVVIEDAAVLDTRETERDAMFGRGLYVHGSVDVIARRVAIERNLESGVYADGGGHAQLEDAVVRATQSQPRDGLYGRGIAVQQAVTIDVSRVLVEDNADVGLIVSEAGTSLSARDLVVRRTRSRALDATRGRGASVQYGANLVLERALIEDNRAIGLFAADPGTTLRAADLIVRGTQLESDGTGGRGGSIQSAVAAVLERALFERNADVGLYVSGAGTTLRATDLAIRETESEGSGRGGRSLNVQVGAAVELTRALIVRGRELGIGALDNAQVHGEDVTVFDTLPAACDVSTCAGSAGGTGVGSFASSAVPVVEYHVSRSALCGVQLAREASIDLHAGTIEGAAVGVCLQVAPYDLARLQDDVVLRDNGVNLQSTELPLPGSSVDL